MNTSIKQLDDNFEIFLDSVIIEDSNTDLTPEKRAERIKLANVDDFAFCNIYFPHIFSEPYNKVHRHIETLTKGKHTISGARRIGKTAFTVVSKLIKPIAIGNNGLLGIGLRTQENARERSAALVRLIKRNKKLQYDYSINIQQDKKGHYIINNTTLLAFSYETGLRNILDDDFKRFKVLVLDDLYNMTSVTSERDNDKVTDFVLSEADGQLEPDGLRIFLGNSINEDCPIVRIKEKFPKTHFSLPALINDKTCWKESKKYTTKYWNHLKETIPFSVWMGEYMDDPLVKGEMLDIDWLRTININTIKIVASISAIDPSTGSSPSASYKGIVTLGITNKAQAVMLELYLRKEGYLSVFDYVFSIRAKYTHWKTLLFENNFNQWFNAQPYYDKWRIERGNNLSIMPFDAKHLKTDYYGSDKDARIMNLVFPHQTGSFSYSDTIFSGGGKSIKALSQDAKIYLSQYLGFGKAKKKLDGLDAAATAFIMLPRYLETGSFKQLKGRRYGNNEDSWLNRDKYSYRK